MRSHHLWTSVVSLTALTFGCGEASVTDTRMPGGNQTGIFWAVRLRDHAINLTPTAPTNTLQLSAVAVDETGKPYVGTIGPIVYSVPDTSSLSVSSTGLLTAKHAGTGLTVIVTLQVGTVTRADTAQVVVTDTVIPVTTLSIHPVNTPAVAAVGFFPDYLTPVDAQGDPLPPIAIAVRSSRATVADVNPFNWSITARQQDTVTFTASTYAYSIRLADSVKYQIGLPNGQVVTVKGRNDTSHTARDTAVALYIQDTVTIATGGSILWTAAHFGFSIDFDDPSAVKSSPALAASYAVPADSGNIRIGPGQRYYFYYAARSFPNAGTYHYRDPVTQVRGTIIVRSQ